jgi:hypothetical protein
MTADEHINWTVADHLERNLIAAARRRELRFGYLGHPLRLP